MQQINHNGAFGNTNGTELLQTSSSFICFDVLISLDNVKARASNWSRVKWLLFVLIKHLFDLAHSQPVLKFFAKKGKTLGVDSKFASLKLFNVVFCIVDKCLHTVFHLVSRSSFSNICRVVEFLSTFSFVNWKNLSVHSLLWVAKEETTKITSHNVPQAGCQPGEWKSQTRMRHLADAQLRERQVGSDSCLQGR